MMGNQVTTIPKTTKFNNSPFESRLNYKSSAISSPYQDKFKNTVVIPPKEKIPETQIHEDSIIVEDIYQFK